MGTFALDLKKFAESTKAKADDAVGGILIRVAAEIDRRSPVGDASYWQSPPPKGYVGGRFRGSWSLGVDQLPAGVETVDPSGAASQGRILAAIPEQASGKLYYLVNPVPYGPRIEQGWSRQAPQGLVALTAMQFQRFVDEAVGAVQ